MKVCATVFRVLCLAGIVAACALKNLASDEVPQGVVLMDQTTAVPIVIAHRGASGYLPEHTTESAATAHAMDADYIEQDCVLSRDGIPVVMHDVTLDDVTNVAEVFADRRRSDGHWYVWDFTLAELRTLNVTERRTANRAWKDRGTRFPLESGRFRISTLEEHLQLIQGLNASRGRVAGIYPEVKEPKKHREAGLDASVAMLKVLDQYGYNAATSPVFVQCFDREEVIRIRRELQCRLPLIYLLSKMPTADEIQEAAGFCDGLGVQQTLVVSGRLSEEKGIVTSLVEQAHAQGLQVHVWTFRSDALPDFVDDGHQWLEWLTVDAGVDGIFADQPDVVLRWRNQRLSQPGQGNPFRLLKQRNAASSRKSKSASLPTDR
jgi:glycerophosphoryl diester phosphodiesterase